MLLIKSTRILVSGKQVSQSQGREVMIEAKFGGMHFKDRGSNYKPRNASGSSC